jgi:hypothetical protein
LKEEKKEALEKFPNEECTMQNSNSSADDLGEFKEMTVPDYV